VLGVEEGDLEVLVVEVSIFPRDEISRMPLPARVLPPRSSSIADRQLDVNQALRLPPETNIGQACETHISVVEVIS
jgi:hypothetical protein